DAATGRDSLTLTLDRALCVAISADGKRIVSGGSKQLTVWDAAAVPKKLRLYSPGTDHQFAAVDPGGSKILAASSDGTLKLCDAATAQEIRTLKGFPFEN